MLTLPWLQAEHEISQHAPLSITRIADRIIQLMNIHRSGLIQHNRTHSANCHIHELSCCDIFIFISQNLEG